MGGRGGALPDPTVGAGVGLAGDSPQLQGPGWAKKRKGLSGRWAFWP